MESSEKLIKQVILFGFGLIGLATVISQLLKCRLKPFVKVGVIRKLFIYPIKALKPVELSQLEVYKRGVQWKQLKDRAFMLVNRKNVMITQRIEPTLALLNVKLDFPYIIVSTPDETDSVKIPIRDEDYEDENVESSEKGEIVETNIWGDNIKGVDCGSKYGQFFSNYLGKPDIKLIRFDSKLGYRPSQYYRDGKLGKDQNIEIMYHDTSVIHLVNTESVETLNSWIESDEKVSYMNFRPNILVEAASFDEDDWEKMRIGSLEFQQLLKCVRCRVTTVDRDKGTFMKEPLVALKRHRLPKNEDLGYIEAPGSNGKLTLPLMGVFFNPESEGEISVGDEVWASHKHKSWF